MPDPLHAEREADAPPDRGRSAGCFHAGSSRRCQPIARRPWATHSSVPQLVMRGRSSGAISSTPPRSPSRGAMSSGSPVAHPVPPAELDRVERERAGDVVHVALEREERLRRAVAAERAGDRPVRVDDVAGVALGRAVVRGEAPQPGHRVHGEPVRAVGARCCRRRAGPGRRAGRRASTPVRKVSVCACRVRAETNSSSRVSSSRTGRRVASTRWPTTSSISISCLPPKPPPMRGLITRIRFTGSPSSGATMRRTWNGHLRRGAEHQPLVLRRASRSRCAARSSSAAPPGRGRSARRRGRRLREQRRCPPTVPPSTCAQTLRDASWMPTLSSSSWINGAPLARASRSSKTAGSSS